MDTAKITVAAVMTAPRSEITYCRNIISNALQQAGIPLNVTLGVFYGQCMQTMLEDLVAKNVDYALTVDYDSLFTAKQIERLLQVIVENDHIDAVVPLQVRRGRPIMLGTVAKRLRSQDGEHAIEIDGSPIEAETAHFGLTVIDLKKLAEVPKPWFMSQPDSQGSWGAEKVDDDVYFWLKWKEAGNTVYFDPQTKIGHVEEMVAFHDENMQATHCYPKQWEAMNGN